MQTGFPTASTAYVANGMYFERSWAYLSESPLLGCDSSRSRGIHRDGPPFVATPVDEGAV
jgi:hypothetical protein